MFRLDIEKARLAAEQQRQQAEAEKTQFRERLRQQLNAILETQESARGLIVNISDVLFDFNKYTLKPGTQVSLAKVSGILQSYPGLKLQVEGYTDSTGTTEFNQKLSENRADAVRDFLVSMGVAQGNIVATGYGQNHPVADNYTVAGRAQNRRVQLVVSGDAIGVEKSVPAADGAAAAGRQCGLRPSRQTRRCRLSRKAGRHPVDPKAAGGRHGCADASDRKRASNDPKDTAGRHFGYQCAISPGELYRGVDRQSQKSVD